MIKKITLFGHDNIKLQNFGKISSECENALYFGNENKRKSLEVILVIDYNFKLPDIQILEVYQYETFILFISKCHYFIYPIDWIDMVEFEKINFIAGEKYTFQYYHLPDKIINNKIICYVSNFHHKKKICIIC